MQNPFESVKDFEIIDDHPLSEKGGGGNEKQDLIPWQILVVDDDDDVHVITDFALRNRSILGRGVQLHNCYSGEEARKFLEKRNDIAVGIIDVVMETEDAGLKLIQHIREQGNKDIRLILRTGQPGYAPELSVIDNYDINDYRTKSELTRTRLLSSLTTALRSFKQINAINQSRKGLEMIIQASEDLLKRDNIELFSKGILEQLTLFLGNDIGGVVCISLNTDGRKASIEDFEIVSDMGTFAGSVGKALKDLDVPHLKSLLQIAMDSPELVVYSNAIAMSFLSRQKNQLLIYTNLGEDFSNEKLALLKVFAKNISACYENVDLIKRLELLAFVDPILGMPNENALKKVLNEMMLSGIPNTYLVLIHIDRLRPLISTFGISVTNDCIKEISKALSAKFKNSVLVAKVAGGDIAILIGKDHFQVEVIKKIFSTPFEINEVQVFLTATVAIVDIKEDLKDAETILRYANAALVSSKNEARGKVKFFDYQISSGIEQRIKLQSSMHLELRKDLPGIVAFFQPKISANTGKVIGAEALARWTLEGKAILPMEFIPIAEASNLSALLTFRIIEQISHWIHSRSQEGSVTMPIAINLAAADLIHRDNFASELIKKIEMEGLSSEDIQFEVTESVLMRDKVKGVEVLKQLREAGFKIAIDDFGTGYSSLSYLQKLPIEVLKIDKSFIDPLNVGNARNSIAAIAISIAQSMGLETVAEGVETEEQSQALKFLGCNVFQGYFFGRPIPMQEFDKAFSEKF